MNLAPTGRPDGGTADHLMHLPTAGLALFAAVVFALSSAPGAAVAATDPTSSPSATIRLANRSGATTRQGTAEGPAADHLSDLLAAPEQLGVALGTTFIDGATIRAHRKAAGAEKRGMPAKSEMSVRRLTALAAATASRPA